MGGEWIFVVQPVADFCVADWQRELLQIRQEMQNVQRLEPGTTVFFAEATNAGPVDNVFASFSYKCDRKGHGDGCGIWYLLWDPLAGGSAGSTHARCAPTNFKRYCYEIQRRLAICFPGSILIEWGDGLDGYGGQLLRSEAMQGRHSSALSKCGQMPAQVFPRQLPAVDIKDLFRKPSPARSVPDAILAQASSSLATDLTDIFRLPLDDVDDARGKRERLAQTNDTLTIDELMQSIDRRPHSFKSCFNIIGFLHTYNAAKRLAILGGQMNLIEVDISSGLSSDISSTPMYTVVRLCNVFLHKKTRDSMLIPPEHAHRHAYSMLRCTIHSTVSPEQDAVEFNSRIDKLKCAERSGPQLLPRPALQNISFALGECGDWALSNRYIARALARLHLFAAMKKNTQTSVYSFLDPRSAFCTALVHRNWADAVSTRQIIERSKQFLLSKLQANRNASCRSYVCGSTQAWRALCCLIRRRQETLSFAYTARLQHDGVFDVLAVLVPFRDQQLSQLQKTLTRQEIKTAARKEFSLRLGKTIVTYTMTSTVQEMDLRSSASKIRIADCVLEVDRLLTSGRHSRRQAMRHFAPMAAAITETPHLYCKYEDQLTPEIRQHKSWLFDFASDCLECPMEVRDWLREKRKHRERPNHRQREMYASHSRRFSRR